jgi:hypothetical protein
MFFPGSNITCFAFLSLYGPFTDTPPYLASVILVPSE